jgi:peroxiredoxin Q/BCP
MFANRISYVIAPDGKILSVVEDSGATAHIQNALAVVKRWREAEGK